MPINNCQYTLLVITSSFRDPEKILKTLREADFMLLEASNQQEAIQRIRTTSPDLILLDIDKSVRQENTILQDFKTNKITGAIPVLFITSMTSENHIPECLNYDNIDFITKPFRPQELVIRVQHQLSLLRAERVIRHHCNILYSLVLMSENAVIFMSYPVNQLFIFFLYCSRPTIIRIRLS